MNRDRNLLFGVLAVQLNKVTPSQLVAAAGAWAADPSVPLHEHLVARGVLYKEDCEVILNLIEMAVRAHDGNEAETLESFGGADEVKKTFSGPADPNGNGATPSGGALPEGEMPEAPSLNETPGRYTHISEYGRGGMGRVLLVHDQDLGRDIVLKELLPKPLPEASTLKAGGTPVRNLMPVVHRFLQEARITGQLEHPSIVPVYEMGRRRDGLLYYTMKLVRGKTMAKALREVDSLGKRLSLLPHYLDLCQAVAYAHERHVIHRDIKPDNVMIGDFGETAVIDWGLAKVVNKEDVHADGLQKTIRAMRLDEPYVPAQTQYGEALGTPVYMPPEQARGELDKVDERSDVYSLGAVLYELLTGALPFDGKSVKGVLAQVTSERPKPIATRVPDAPPELVAICERAMNPDRAKRYRNAKELATEIERFMSGALVQAYSYRFGEHLKRFIKRHKPILTTAAVGVAALLLVSVISYFRIVQERNAAIAARNDAVVARDDEKHQRETAEQQLYLSSIYLAREGIENGRYDVARQALDRAPESLRQWEWRYYRHLCHLDERTLAGHAGPLEWIEYSADGTRLLTASMDSTAKLWDAASGVLLRTLAGHDAGLMGARFSPDGVRIATISYDRTAKIWDAATGQELWKLTDLSGGGEAFEFSKDSARVTAACGNSVARVWDAASGRELAVLSGHGSAILSASFSPDGARVATASQDRTARVWDASTGRQALSLACGSPVEGVSFSPDGSRILTWSRDGIVQVWDASSGAESATLKGAPHSVGRASFSADGARAVAAYYDGAAKVFDTRTGEVLATLNGVEKEYADARFSSDGSRILTPAENNAATLRDAQTGSEILRLTGHSNRVVAAIFSPDGTHVATASRDGTAKVWNVQKPAMPERFTLAGHTAVTPSGVQLRDPFCRIEDLAMNKGGSRLITAAADGTAKVWDLAAGHELFTLSGHTDKVIKVRLSGDERRILTVSDDRTAKLWDAATGSLLHTLAGHSADLRDAQFSPDGQRVVTASEDATAKLWDTASGSELLTLKGHTDKVWSVAFSPDGTKIVTASGDKTARLWDAASGKELHSLSGHSAEVVFAAFSPDGARVITVSYDMTPRIWDAATGQELATLSGNASRTLTVVFTPDGQKVLTGLDDGTAKLWELATGKEIRTFTGHERSLFSAAFSPDGRRLVTGAFDGTARLWDVASGLEVAALPTRNREVRSVLFTPDGTRLVASSGNVAQLWGGW